MSGGEIESVDAPSLKARISGAPIAEYFRFRYQPYIVRLDLPPPDAPDSDFVAYGEAWVRVRDFVGDTLTENEYDWSYEGRTISFYFTDQLTAAKVRLLA